MEKPLPSIFARAILSVVTYIGANSHVSACDNLTVDHSSCTACSQPLIFPSKGQVAGRVPLCRKQSLRSRDAVPTVI